MTGDTLRIAFLHPDLGIGGAERLIVDAASELSAAGHEVDIYTAHYDPARCFEETRSGAFKVVVAGSWVPRSLIGSCIALCAYLRCIFAAFALAKASNRSNRPYDVIIADQVSVVVPLLKWLTMAKVLFYCHFPDLLLAKRPSLLHRLYRAPLDWLEQWSTGKADCLAVNSSYTQGVFAKTFSKLHKRGIVPEVVYPAVQIPTDQVLAEAQSRWREELPPDIAAAMAESPVFLSINRFERKKALQGMIKGLPGLWGTLESMSEVITVVTVERLQNIELALRSLHELHQQRQHGSAATNGRGPLEQPALVVTGGYDVRLPENVDYYEELTAIASDLGLSDKVFFLRSCSDWQKELLLCACTGVLYTPEHEHFGIVPLEAMSWGKPVLACNSGGPKESVVDGHTGMLCEATPAAFAQAMGKLLVKAEAQRLGAEAREHVQQQFSREVFGGRLLDLLYGLVEEDVDSHDSG